MASTIKVNNIQNQCGANIVNKCSTTITLGASGDNITLACGATQSGFGRTGTVDWDTTAKTAGFTAVSGNGYFVNTASGAITVTLPASPSAGDIVSVKDYAATFDTNSCTIARNSQPIDGQTFDLVLNSKSQATTLIYVDGTKGWTSVNSNDVSNTPKFVSATGGTETTCGDYRIHTFTSPGSFVVSCGGNPGGSATVDYLVVAGGGAGSSNTASNNAGSGGGAGGYRESSGAASGCYTASPLGACVSALPVTATSYPITVGGGGAVFTASPNGPGGDGSNSVFSTITSAGGGGGGAEAAPGRNGGSGGGAGSVNNGTPLAPSTAGVGNTPPVSPPQGQNGGRAAGSGNFGAGGGGGAGATGSNGTPGAGGAGGNGVTTNINTSPVTRAGGGGGATYAGGSPGPGGSGGGGNGGPGSNGPGSNGSTNTGGGGGGAGVGPGNNADGGAGGSGIVIIRYKYQ